MDEIKQYTVASIIGSYPAQFDKTRVVFTTNETGAQQLSGFFKYPPAVGKTISGVVSITEKDGKTYHNFTPKAGNSAPRPMGAPASSGGMSLEQFTKLFQEVYAIRTGQQLLIQLLQEQGVLPKKNEVVRGVEYPTNNLADAQFRANSGLHNQPAKPVSADDFNFSEDESPC